MKSCKSKGMPSPRMYVWRVRFLVGAGGSLDGAFAKLSANRGTASRRSLPNPITWFDHKLKRRRPKLLGALYGRSNRVV